LSRRGLPHESANRPTDGLPLLNWLDRRLGRRYPAAFLTPSSAFVIVAAALALFTFYNAGADAI
jgi:hypothetical protein